MISATTEMVSPREDRQAGLDWRTQPGVLGGGIERMERDKRRPISRTFKKRVYTGGGV